MFQTIGIFRLRQFDTGKLISSLQRPCMTFDLYNELLRNVLIFLERVEQRRNVGFLNSLIRSFKLFVFKHSLFLDLINKDKQMN